MYRRCTTEKAALQQRRLEECLLAMMQDKLLAEISVSAMCEETGLSRKTFYRLFDSKQDVLHALVDRVIREYIRFRLPREAVEPGVSEELLTFYTYWQEQRELLDALSKNGLSTILYDRCIQHMVEEETDVLRQIGIDPGPERNEETLMFFLSGLLTVMVSWHHTGYRKSPRQMAAITEKIFTAPPIRSY